MWRTREPLNASRVPNQPTDFLQFCYVCSERWKTCACPQWEENNLLARANTILQRNPRRQLYEPEFQTRTQPQTRRPSVAPAAAAVGGASNNHLPVTDLDWKFNDDDLTFAYDSVSGPDSDSDSESHSDSDLDFTPNAVAVPPLRTVQDVVDNLRANHECDHEKWKWVRGPHTCEECHFRLPQYIFECRQCELQACNRCRRNRL
jgi:hypothetical protein